MKPDQKDYNLYKEIKNSYYKKNRKVPVLKILTVSSVVFLAVAVFIVLNQNYDITGRVTQMQKGSYKCRFPEKGLFVNTYGNKLMCSIESTAENSISLKISNYFTFPNNVNIRINSIQLNDCRIDPSRFIQAKDSSLFIFKDCSLAIKNKLVVQYTNLNSNIAHEIVGEITI